jgi:dTDP-glucose 4,6-dehydratase
MVGQSWEYPEHWFMTNAVSITRLFSQLHKRDFLKKYVHITTPEVYGNTSGWIKEDTAFNPSTPYAVSRAAGDMSLKSYFDNFNFPMVATRAANVYGAGQQLYRIIPRTILFIRLGKQLELHGGGVSQRSFIHINDVSDATWKVMLNGKLGDTYHISTKEIVSIRQLVELICKKMDVDFDQYVKVGPERIGKDAAYMLDSSKCRKEVAWTDKITLEQGLEECIDWVDSNLDVLKEQSHDYIHKP